MIITNKLNLPETFVNFVKQDYQFKPNEYRVTSLLKGYKEILLERRHRNEIEQDVSDMIWLLFGTAVHGVLEKSQENNNEFKEERLRVNFGKFVLSGQFDLYNAQTKTLTDYKTASVWKVVFGDYNDWKKQLLMYAYMLKDAGFDVEKAQIVALLKDHSKTKAKTDSTYPQLPVAVIPFKFTSQDFENIKEFIQNKFTQIELMSKLPDHAIPPCTAEERYNSGNKFAVMKKGRKTALRVVGTEKEAKDYIKWAAENKNLKETDLTINKRAGEDKKCKDYCSVCEFCNYYCNNVKGHKQ